MHTTHDTPRYAFCLGLTSLLLLLGGHCAGAEPPRGPGPSRVPQKVTRTVQVKAGNVVAIAIGEAASATTQIASLPGQSPGESTVTVEVDTLWQQALGAKATVCLQLPGGVTAACN